MERQYPRPIKKAVLIKFKTYNVASKENRKAAIRRARKKYKKYTVDVRESTFFSPTLKGYVVHLKLRKRRK
jgi:hypothetical protein